MRPERGAGGAWERAGPAEETPRARIVDEPAVERKRALSVGACVSCGQCIRLIGGATTCSTCSAWRRWYSAHRLASAALREATR